MVRDSVSSRSITIGVQCPFTTHCSQTRDLKFEVKTICKLVHGINTY